MNDEESPLASIDLHAWRVPPPVEIDRSALLGRALSPSTIPPKSSRLGWIIAAIVVANALVAALIVLLARPASPPAPLALPAGGADDARVHELVQLLEQQQRELERRFTELEELEKIIIELSDKVKAYEVRDKQLDKPSPDNSIPDGLDRDAISKTITALKPKIVACGERGATGTVRARVRVAPSGSVVSVDAGATDSDLGKCVANIISTATFPATKNGGSFTYPFVFR